MFPDPGGFDKKPEDSKEPNKEENQRNKDAKKFKLDRNNPTDQKILDNLDTPVEEFIAKNRKASTFRETPGEYLNTPVRKVMEDAKSGNSVAKKTQKLLIDGRFSK